MRPLNSSVHNMRCRDDIFNMFIIPSLFPLLICGVLHLLNEAEKALWRGDTVKERRTVLIMF